MSKNKDALVYWGISSGHHDAAISVVQHNKLLYSSHSERYSKTKNDPNIHIEQLKEALQFGHPDKIFFYENAYLKKIRFLKSLEFFRMFENPVGEIIKLLSSISSELAAIPISVVNHHRSHAAAAFYTSQFEEGLVIVADGVGESETFSIYQAHNGKLSQKPFWKLKYPSSIGLFYSAVTDAVGLKANEEEYILMGMAALGDKFKDRHFLQKYVNISIDNEIPKWNTNINFHKKLNLQFDNEQEKFDTAANAQHLLENYLLEVLKSLQLQFPKNRNWIFGGGVALNCVLNTKIAESLCENSRVYICPNPGDAGSSLGALLANTQQNIELKNLFFGTEINSQTKNIEVVEYLLKNKICGLARGKAEFGPRALGNRSLLADPRDPDIKNLVNEIKNRQKFRPFAAAVLEEHANVYFELPRNILRSPYMQFVAKVKEPVKYQSICHVDGTCRIQTVNLTDNPDLYDLLMIWYKKTGCPFLLNTSLNIRGQPMVNNLKDCAEFSFKYNVKVFN